jgi:hypothetical protein
MKVVGAGGGDNDIVRLFSNRVKRNKGKQRNSVAIRKTFFETTYTSILASSFTTDTTD